MFSKSPGPFVVAISGTSGTGKTTLTKEVTTLLDDAVSLHFDDYAARNTLPSDIPRWFSDGADLNRIETPQLIEDLLALRNQRTLSLSGDQGERKPAKYIIVDEPFGRAREKIARYFDFVLYIDVPLEISLARGILRTLHTGGEILHLPPERLVSDVKEFLSNYLYHSWRDVYLLNKKNVRRNCDLILDGMKTVDELAQEAIKAIQVSEDDGFRRHLGPLSKRFKGWLHRI